MHNSKIGKVTHYYNKLCVAIISLDTYLAKDEKIMFTRGGEDLFSQKVESIQIEHTEVDIAQKGDIVGIKTDLPVKEGAEVYRLAQ
jgi:GTPase